MGHIEIAGLGAGTLNQLSMGLYKKLTRSERPIYVRTLDHPVIKELQAEGISFIAFDDIYEANEDFQQVYEQIVSELIIQAKFQPIIYAVPGHPMLAEQTVQLLLEQTDIDVVVTGGHSYLDDLFTALKIDPIEGFQFIDATDFNRHQLNFRNHLIFCQIYDTFSASNVKLALLEDLPATYQVTVVEAVGTPDETIRKISLEDVDRSLEISNLTTLYVPPVPLELQNHTFTRLREVIATLRGPNGCPWDKKQTHESLREFAIEEVYELIEAVDEQDDEWMVEELGDVFLQVMLHSQIGEDNGYFTIDDVIQTLTEKMIHRHPHVFADAHVESVDEVSTNWDALKQAEKGNVRKSAFDGIPKNLPALANAYKIQEKASKINIAHKDKQTQWKDIEKKQNLLWSLDSDSDEVEAAFGQLLFALVCLSQTYHVNPETALNLVNKQFMQHAKGDK